jgi:hypothetical protein
LRKPIRNETRRRTSCAVPAIHARVQTHCAGADRPRAGARARSPARASGTRRSACGARSPRASRQEMQSPPVRRILCGTLAGTVTTIPLGRRSLAGSSHLPAASPSRIIGRLFGVAPRRDCPFHPRPSRRAGRAMLAHGPNLAPTFSGRCEPRLRASRLPRLVSVALILTLRWAGVTCYAALRSPDVPRLRIEDAVARRTLQSEFYALAGTATEISRDVTISARIPSLPVGAVTDGRLTVLASTRPGPNPPECEPL